MKGNGRGEKANGPAGSDGGERPEETQTHQHALRRTVWGGHSGGTLQVTETRDWRRSGSDPRVGRAGVVAGLDPSVRDGRDLPTLRPSCGPGIDWWVGRRAWPAADWGSVSCHCSCRLPDLPEVRRDVSPQETGFPWLPFLAARGSGCALERVRPSGRSHGWEGGGAGPITGLGWAWAVSNARVCVAGYGWGWERRMGPWTLDCTTGTAAGRGSTGGPARDCSAGK